ncbi:uncharacterized protein LOC122513930 [Polistes fuscatus]|uniref:uncharacterized protein LOC122513930 n=1 Tax=Polistes fuscatus TaxID=30207 RepID=UPI001CA8E420|nr:uncharacterized protein LOC122513930 [Polistes fuscatus]
MASGGRLFNEHFFFSNKLVLTICGLHPDQSKNDQLFLFCAITLYVFPALVHQFYQLFTSEVIMKDTVNVLQKTFGIIALLLAYSTTYFSFLTVSVFDMNEHGLFNGYGISIIAPCVVRVLLYFSGILDENQLQLIVPVNNISKAGVIYFCLLIYQIIGVIIVVTVGAISFSGYLIAVLFACYQFRVLILKIRRPFEKSWKYFGNDCCFRKPEEEWDWIIDVINRYKNATEYVDLLNQFSKMTYLLTEILAMMLIIFDFVYIFQVSIDLQNSLEIIECSLYIAGSIVTLYNNFYFGQELINYSDEVFEELCQVPFYILSKKSQKTLLFMIIRSCKPSILSIGGMFVSSHESFAALMKKAFSFAMVYYNYV